MHKGHSRHLQTGYKTPSVEALESISQPVKSYDSIIQWVSVVSQTSRVSEQAQIFRGSERSLIVAQSFAFINAR